MAKKATAKSNKQCPLCKMEVDSAAETCPGCAAVFDDSPSGATAVPEIPDDEAAPNGEEAEPE
jgi:hypothetical protein